MDQKEIDKYVASGQISGPIPFITIDAADPDAIPILKFAISQAHRRCDAKAAHGYAENRTRFLKWIEDQRALEAEANREAQADRAIMEKQDTPAETARIDAELNPEGPGQLDSDDIEAEAAREGERLTDPDPPGDHQTEVDDCIAGGDIRSTPASGA